jgi:hypothetical protein
MAMSLGGSRILTGLRRRMIRLRRPARGRGPLVRQILVAADRPSWIASAQVLLDELVRLAVIDALVDEFALGLAHAGLLRASGRVPFPAPRLPPLPHLPEHRLRV